MVGISALRALFGRFPLARHSTPSAWVEPSNAITRAIEGDLRAAFEQAYAETLPVAAPAFEAAPAYRAAPAVEAAPVAPQSPAAPAEEDSRAA